MCKISSAGMSCDVLARLDCDAGRRFLFDCAAHAYVLAALGIAADDDVLSLQRDDGEETNEYRLRECVSWLVLPHG